MMLSRLFLPYCERNYLYQLYWCAALSYIQMKVLGSKSLLDYFTEDKPAFDIFIIIEHSKVPVPLETYILGIEFDYDESHDQQF